MEYKHGKPITKQKREIRRDEKRVETNAEEERNRQRSKTGGKPNELGVVQGQNGEQGNTTDPRLTEPYATPGEK
jgi:hypothetical protein